MIRDGEIDGPFIAVHTKRLARRLRPQIWSAVFVLASPAPVQPGPSISQHRRFASTLSAKLSARPAAAGDPNLRAYERNPTRCDHLSPGQNNRVDV